MTRKQVIRLCAAVTLGVAVYAASDEVNHHPAVGAILAMFAATFTWVLTGIWRPRERTASSVVVRVPAPRVGDRSTGDDRTNPPERHGATPSANPFGSWR
jgi:hypothetical protein